MFLSFLFPYSFVVALLWPTDKQIRVTDPLFLVVNFMNKIAAMLNILFISVLKTDI
ncbi:putative membrane protein [Vibrio parahaemolyticus VPTS-2009]|nr:putative membrane protein [Vibrio parahaemolyticus VPTS-2009]